jgi:hypothetical protein
MTRRTLTRLSLGLALIAPPMALADAPRFEAQEIDPSIGKVCYALTTADLNGDGKLDVVAISEEAVVWYENPTWTKRDILRGGTERDNVCVQAHDIDGDGRIDLTLGAGWRPADTQGNSTLQWLGCGPDGAWRLHPIRFDDPSMHRIRWGDVQGDGRARLVCAPLQGRGTRGPNWGEGPGVRVTVYTIPADPTAQDWPHEVADDTLHTIHNLWLTNLDDDPQNEILLAAWEGVFALDRGPDGRWSRTRLGTGNQTARPNKGASEIKLGRLASGKPYIATIEPWHGTQVVVYLPPDSGNGLWDRHVLDEPVAWGHGVWCADLDGNGGEELIIGQRDPNRDPSAPVKGPGVFVYDLDRAALGGPKAAVPKQVVDDGGMACEDLVAADLDGDGRPEIIAGGRATHNVKIYWNRPGP